MIRAERRPRLPLVLLHRGDGQLVGHVVELVVGVAFHPHPVHVVALGLVQEGLPQPLVLDVVVGGGLPVVLLPAVEPALVEGVREVGAVGVEGNRRGLVERAQRFEGGGELHAVVGAVGLAAGQLVGVAAVLGNEDGGPAAGAGVAAAGAVSVDRHVFLGHNAGEQVILGAPRSESLLACGSTQRRFLRRGASARGAG